VGASGGVIAFERTGGGQNPTAIYLMNPDGSDQRRLTTGYHFEWSPDGTMIAFHRPSPSGFDDIWVVSRDGSTLRRVVSGRSYGELTWSPDNRQIAFTGGYTQKGSAIFVVNTDGSGLARLTSPTGYTDDLLPDWSPDGSRIAFERDRYDVSEQGGNTRFLIITMKPDGTDQRILARSPLFEWPAWSPDGSRVAAQATEGIGTQRDIYVINADGTAQRNLTHTPSPSEYEPRWSPNGRKILFESRSGKNRNVHVVNADGTRHQNLARSTRYDGQPNWSPDGRSIVFVSNRDGNRDIYVMDASGRNQTNLTNMSEGTVSAQPRWSPR
jgi:TolB protein